MAVYFTFYILYFTGQMSFLSPKH